MVQNTTLLKQLEIISKIGQTSTKEKDLKSSTLKRKTNNQKSTLSSNPTTNQTAKTINCLGVGFSGIYGIKYGIKLVSFIKGLSLWA